MTFFFVIFELMHCDYILYQPGTFWNNILHKKELSGSPDFVHEQYDIYVDTIHTS